MSQSHSGNRSHLADTAPSLKTSKRDKSSSLLFALTTLTGLGVILLATILIARLPRSADRDVTVIEFGEGTENPPGVGLDSEPLLEADQDDNDDELGVALSDVGEYISIALDGGGKGKGGGDRRDPGPPGPGPGSVPAYQRWELKFSARDVNGYAQTLDHFKMELAAVGGGQPLVEYASNFTTTPSTHKGAGDQEKRLYFMYRNEGPLLQYDRLLLKKSGVSTDNRTVLKFIPADLQAQLQGLELQYAAKYRGPNTKVSDIAKTIYECQNVGGELQWIVVNQFYRKSKPTANIKVCELVAESSPRS